MVIDLRTALPHLLPEAVVWAEARADEVAVSGRPLDDSGIALSRSVEVQGPERIRVLVVARLPLPVEPTLREAALQSGLLGPGMVGLTLGYSVIICKGHLTRRLMSHEFRHVHQYERHGSISAFLPVYLRQIVEFGYANSPLEMDARTHEVSDAEALAEGDCSYILRQ